MCVVCLQRRAMVLGNIFCRSQCGHLTARHSLGSMNNTLGFVLLEKNTSSYLSAHAADCLSMVRVPPITSKIKHQMGKKSVSDNTMFGSLGPYFDMLLFWTFCRSTYSTYSSDLTRLDVGGQNFSDIMCVSVRIILPCHYIANRVAIEQDLGYCHWCVHLQIDWAHQHVRCVAISQTEPPLCRPPMTKP